MLFFLFFFGLFQDTYTLHYLHNGMKQTTTYITLHYNAYTRVLVIV